MPQDTPDVFLCSGIVTDGGPDWEPTDVIDSYESLVWTERYNANGDFTLKTPYNKLFSPGPAALRKYIAFNGNYMLIETIDSGTENKDSDLVTLTGRDFTKVLMDRDARKTSTTAAQPDSVFTGTAANFAVALVNDYCINSGSEPIISGFSALNAAAANPDANNSSQAMSTPQDTVYNMVKAVLDAYQLGFKIVASGNTLTFYVYGGTDNSTAAMMNLFPDSLLSPDDETLASTSYIESTANYKNHARVLGAKTGVDVYLPGTTPTGLDLRTVTLLHSEVGPDNTTTTAQDQAALTVIGNQYLALSANAYTYVIDGTLNPTRQFNPGLGDICTVQNPNGRRDRQRITEMVYTSDNTGYKVNPTFTSLT
jgi:hypothetical protein